MRKVFIYTDGACSGNPGPGGFGVLLMSEGVPSKEISKGFFQTTNNRMELLAVITAFESLKSPCNVHLYSDSKYVVDSLLKGWAKKWQSNNWKKSDKSKAENIDLWERMLNVIEEKEKLGFKITLHWVKGHAGHEHNEKVDELSVIASKNPTEKDVGFEKR